jgi:hypothetical protein
LAWNDIISSYLEYSKNRTSPEIFRKWAGISIVSGALERRVWTKIGPPRTYPNLFVLLIGPPGTGKSEAISPATDLLRKAKTIAVAPSSTTSASLIDAFTAARKIFSSSTQHLEEFHPLFVSASEFGVFFPEYNGDFMSLVCDLWDNPPQHSIQRIWRGKDAVILAKPCLSILGGTTPGFLGGFLPESAWKMGFTARFMLIYAGTGPRMALFSDVDMDTVLEKQIVDQLVQVEKLHGQMQWEAEAAAELVRWYKDGCEPVPQHSKMTHYLVRRPVHLAKLAMICAISRTGTLVIGLEDLTRAKDLLFEAETLVPDIFRDMAGKSDSAVIEELHFALRALWNSPSYGQKKPIPKSMVYKFLADRVPSWQVDKVLEMCIKSDVVVESPCKTGFIPRPKRIEKEFG